MGEEKSDGYVTRTYLNIHKAARKVWLWNRNHHHDERPLIEQDIHAVTDGIKYVCGDDDRTIHSNLKNFMDCGIIKRVIHNEQDKIEQVTKDLKVRTIEEILGGPIEKKFEKKYH